MQRFLPGGGREWLLIAASALILLAVLLLPLRLALADLTAEEEQLLNAYHSDELIRIHVIANSNSAQDQALKYKVRDALIDAFGLLIRQAGANGSQSVYAVLQENIDSMRTTAQNCALQHGFTGTVNTEVGRLALPQKQYGSVVLPAGEYRALRITLGEGKGENWWCVLYPQLCLALSQTDEPADPVRLHWHAGRILGNWLLISK